MEMIVGSGRRIYRQEHGEGSDDATTARRRSGLQPPTGQQRVPVDRTMA
jgi:hypothetical protein